MPTAPSSISALSNMATPNGGASAPNDLGAASVSLVALSNPDIPNGW